MVPVKLISNPVEIFSGVFCVAEVDPGVWAVEISLLSLMPLFAPVFASWWEV